MNKSPNCIVETTAGKIEGVFDRNLFVFRGIPYASPPVGHLRWLPPEPPQPWSGVRPAFSAGKACPQPSSQAAMIRDFVVDESQSEDCLYLNIWTPGLDNARRPVMVWIHGGYFTMGSGSQSVFQGHNLASHHDVVIVTLNYRLGLFGFLNLNEATQGRIPSTGNEGLLDQIAALQWVRRNISRFGGNPDNITIFGESAGAMSIECLMSMPQSCGLFHKAVLQSSVSRLLRTLDESNLITEQWFSQMGMDGQNIFALRELSTDKIVSSLTKLSSTNSGKKISISPVVDGKILSRKPLDSFLNGTSLDIPVICGTNRDESQLFSVINPNSKIDEAALVRRCRRMVPAGSETRLIEAYRSRLIESLQPASPADIYTAIQTDYNFSLPAQYFLEARCKRKQLTYNYLFNWKSPAFQSRLGACHGLEIGFVFGTYDASFGGSGPEVDRLSLCMQNAWASFARSGIPDCPDLGQWPSYCHRQGTLLFGRQIRIEKSPNNKPLQIWTELGVQ